jgi:hypothetical protein
MDAAVNTPVATAANVARHGAAGAWLRALSIEIAPLRRRFVSLVPTLLLLACVCAGPAPRVQAQDAYAPEKVKAAFLYHFGKFIDWPKDAPSGDTFTIAVLGAKPVADELRQLAPDRSVQNRTLRVREIRSVDEVGAAQILFIHDDNSARLPRVLAPLHGRPVLIVTDVDDGLKMGAAINFTIAEQRLRFEISQAQAKQAGLYFSSRLLAIALRVEPAG